MRKRTKAREYALQVLYQMEITQDGYEESLKSFWKIESEEDNAVLAFTGSLVRGVAEHKKEIDGYIIKYATNWHIGRMAVIDRNILRIAIFEMLHLDDIPSKVSINEAVDIAKKYGDKDSGKFVNGILDKINKVEAEKKLKGACAE